MLKSYHHPSYNIVQPLKTNNELFKNYISMGMTLKVGVAKQIL